MKSGLEKHPETADILQAILDNTADNIILIGNDHKVIVCNGAMKNSLKLLTGNEINPGGDYRDFVTPGNKELYLQSFAKSIKGETIIVENEIKTEKDSFWFRYKMNPIYDTGKQISGVVLTVSNIDLRKKNEVALHQSKEELAAAAKQLDTSEKYFRTLIETSSDAIVLIDANGKVIYQTPSTQKINGYSLQDMQSIDGLELIHPDDRDEDNKAFTELVTTPGAILQRMHRLKHKNGRYIWIDGTYRNLLHDENVKAIVYTYSDVTARVLSESRLKERIKELSTIYNINSILENEHKSVDDVFNEIANLLPAGWQYPEICEARITFNDGEYSTPGYTASGFKQCAEIKTQDGRSGTIEVIYTRKMADEDEGPFLREERELINTLAKIIEVYFNKKSNQDALAKSQANLVSILDNTNIAYLLLDDHLNIVAFNQYLLNYYRELTGITFKTGRNFIDFLIPERRDIAERALQRVLTTSTPIEYEAVYNNKEPVKYYTNIVNPVVTNGETIGLCITIIDITHKKNNEIERQKIVADLINRNRDLREFAQIVSHNLRGPLATMLGLTNMLKDSITEEEKDFVLEGVGMSAEKLDAVVMELNNILNVKTESSETKATVDLAGLIEEIKEKFLTIITASKAEIECNFSAPEILTMRSFTYNIFYNLISNSLKYRDENRAPKIRIWSEKKNGEIILSVSDNGTGIDMKKYGDHIFLLNKRFHNTADGKGLGLFIVKAQVDVLNGTIEIDSEPGAGTTIKVILPV